MGALPDHQAGDVGWQEDGGQQEVTADIPPLLRPLHQPGQAELLDPEGQGEKAVEEGGGEGPEDDWDDDGEDDAGQTKPWPGRVSDRAGQINLLIITVQSKPIPWYSDQNHIDEVGPKQNPNELISIFSVV